MKAILAAAALVVVGALLQRGITAEPRADLPTGVETSQWIPIGDNAGFLITPEKATAYQPPGGRQVLAGYFFAKRNGQWFRLNVAPVGTIVQTR